MALILFQGQNCMGKDIVNELEVFVRIRMPQREMVTTFSANATPLAHRATPGTTRSGRSATHKPWCAPAVEPERSYHARR